MPAVKWFCPVDWSVEKAAKRIAFMKARLQFSFKVDQVTRVILDEETFDVWFDRNVFEMQTYESLLPPGAAILKDYMPDWG